MNTLLKASLVTALAWGATASVAHAHSVSITTDQVHIRTGANGTVQIRTTADRPVVLNVNGQGVRSTQQFTPVPYSSFCSPRLHSHQSQSHQTNSSGHRVYTESRSSSRVCQVP